MNKELIEKLKIKYYVRAFGLMLPEEQECFKEVGKGNCLWYYSNSWSGNSMSDNCFSNHMTYAIKPDYQPEPEFVDLEITRQGNWLGITRPWAEDYSRFPSDFNNLHCLPSLPNFEFFFYWKETGIREIFFDDVATRIRKDKEKVYARFRK